MREPHYGPLVHGGVLSCLDVFFVLRVYIARQGGAEAYGGYDELLHGFWGNQLNRGKLLPFLGGKASILFLLARPLVPGRTRASLEKHPCNSTLATPSGRYSPSPTVEFSNSHCGR
jgi:hypothetical protein